MSNKKETSEAIDIILKLLALGSLTGVILAAPNAVQALDKPLKVFFDKMDEREKARSLSKLKSYMKTQGLVRGDYSHGIELTKKAIKRLSKLDYKEMTIDSTAAWDGKWRIIFFDIPESKRAARVGFTRKIQSLGAQILQQSVWVHPFDCEEIIFKVAKHFDVLEWVTYVETAHISNEAELKKRFKKIL